MPKSLPVDFLVSGTRIVDIVLQLVWLTSTKLKTDIHIQDINHLLKQQLSLHLGKTECILFGPRRKLKGIQDFSVTCNGHHIKSTNTVKYLGLIIDNNLSGDFIVDSIVKKVNNRLRFLYRQANFLDVKCKLSLCSALISCHIDYACSSWYSGLTKGLQQKLQVCQNKVVRFILNLPPMYSVNYSVLSSLNLLNVEDRVKQLQCTSKSRF